MSALAARFRRFRLLYFSKPVRERLLLQTIAKRPVHKILEIGIGTGERALRMIEVAGFQGPRDRLSYIGIDLFEGRPAEHGPGLSLKEAHKRFSATGVQVRLLPGDPYSVLARTANSLTEIDLVVISALLDRQSMARAWFYLPRMLHPKAIVLIEPSPKPGRDEPFRTLSTRKVGEIAAKAAEARRAA